MAGPRKLDPNEIKKIHSQGLKILQIAHIFGVDQSSIGYWLKKMKLQPNGTIPQRRSKGKEHEILKLHSQGLSNLQISLKLNLDHTCICNFIRRKGLKYNGPQKQPIEMMSETEAKCSKCKEIKSIDKWPWGRSTNSPYPYRLSYCKDCKKKQARENVNGRPLAHLKLMYNLCKNKCPKRKLDFTVSFDEIKSLYEMQGNRCFYTGLEMTMKRGRGAHPNSLSFDRIDVTKGYVSGNVVLCCRRINTIKSDMKLNEMKEWTPKWHEKIEMYRGFGLTCLKVCLP